MKVATRAFICFVCLITLAFALSGCSGFFVSPTAVGEIAVTPTAAILTVTGTPNTQQLAVSSTLVNGSAGPDVTSSATYSSSPTGIVTVSAGLVTAAAAGGTTVTVSDSGATAQVSFVVTSAAITNVLTITPTNPTVAVNGTQQLVAKASDGTIIPTDPTTFLTWSSSNTSTASVSASGVVTGLVAGTATITVTVQASGQTATGTTTITVG